MGVTLTIRPSVDAAARRILPRFDRFLIAVTNSTAVEWRGARNERGDEVLELWQTWGGDVRLATIGRARLREDKHMLREIEHDLVVQIDV